MSRSIACAVAAALLTLAALAPAAPVPGRLGKQPVYYFPTKVGAKLEYDEPGRQLTLVVTKVEEKGGAKHVSVGRVGRDESVTPYMTMAVTGTGVYRLDRGGKKLDTPEIWLQLPAERGDEWEFFTGDPTLPQRTKAKLMVLGPEEVTVPAGTFRAIRVQCLERERTITQWYAPDVGLVKTTAMHWEEVLMSYTPGKD